MARGGQFLLALVFLTRLPLGRYLPPRVLPLAEATWAFPLAGALIGALAGLPLWLSGPGLLQAALSVAAAVLLTGALHEDGLADFADAAGGRDREARLAIMRDSRIGSYGVMALVLTTALRITALAGLGPLHLIAAAAMGRGAAVLAMAGLLPARDDGLGHDSGRPGWRNVTLASALSMLAALIAGPGCGLALVLGLLVLGFTIRQARIWLGGQTGDVLGASSLLVETAVLAGFALAI